MSGGGGGEIGVKVQAGGLGGLHACNITPRCKQKPSYDRRVTGQRCYDGMPNQTGTPLGKHGSHKSQTRPSACGPSGLLRSDPPPIPPPSSLLPAQLLPSHNTYIYTIATSFAVGGDGCPCPFSPRCGGGCKVMMSSSSGGFQMYCSPLPMNTASW